MHIVIAGAGRVGGQLATDFAAEGHDLVVIDNDTESLDRLGKAFNGLAIEGEAYDVDVLEQAQTDRAEVFCAMTDDDNTNLMAAEVAKAVFEVPRVLARLQDPAREGSYRALGIPYISTTNLIASVALETILSSEFAIHVTFSGGDVEIVEFTLGAAAEGLTVATLEIERSLRVAAVTRGGTTFIPSTHAPLQPGDLVVAAATDGVRERIDDYVTDNPE